MSLSMVTELLKKNLKNLR